MSDDTLRPLISTFRPPYLLHHPQAGAYRRRRSCDMVTLGILHHFIPLR